MTVFFIYKPNKLKGGGDTHDCINLKLTLMKGKIESEAVYIFIQKAISNWFCRFTIKVLRTTI